MTTSASLQIQIWPIDRLVFYTRNPSKNNAAVDRIVASIHEFGFKIPVLARSDGEVVDAHLRLKAARMPGIAEVTVILCDEWSAVPAVPDNIPREEHPETDRVGGGRVRLQPNDPISLAV